MVRLAWVITMNRVSEAISYGATMQEPGVSKLVSVKFDPPLPTASPTSVAIAAV